MPQSAPDKALSRIIGWVRDDIVGEARWLEKVMPRLAIPSIVQIGGDHRAASLFQNPHHAAVAARRLPDLALEPLVIDESVSSPSRRREKIRPVQISKTLERRLEAAVEIVRRVHSEKMEYNHLI
jgi:hypothetical protein